MGIEGCGMEGDKGDFIEFMEEEDSFEKGDKFLIEDFIMEIVCELIEILYILIVKLILELMGFKFLLYWLLFNLFGEEVIEFFCVEVENESLIERL